VGAERPSLESRIRRYYAFDMLVAFQLWSPFWTLWLFDHADAFQATLVDIVFWIVSLLVTMPAGAIADRYGRKPALLVGVAIWDAGIVLFGLAGSLPIFALANGIWALGAAFMWGTASAYLYDTLAEAGQEERYPKVVSRAAMLTYLATAAAVPLGGLLVFLTRSLAVPLLVYAVPGLAALVVAATFREPAVRRQAATGLAGQIRMGLRTTRDHRPIVLVIVFQVLIGVVTYVMAFFRSPFIGEIVGGDFLLMGFVWSAFFVVAAVGGLSMGRLLERVGEGGALRIAFFLVFPPFLVVYGASAGWFSPGLGLTLAVLAQTPYYVLWGFEGPMVTTIINRRVGSSDRATVLGISTFFVTLALAIFEPLVGLLVDATDIGTALALMALVAVVPSAYVVAAFRRHETLVATPVAPPVLGRVP